MQKAELLITQSDEVYTIKVNGRANFECGVPLREFAKKITAATRGIIIDLQECVGMDSTFMGILSMIGLKTRNNGLTVEITNAGTFNRNLLKGLGVEKLFKFTETTPAEPANWARANTGQPDRIGTAETVVDAHKTLINIDLDNLPKFEKVVEYAEEDLERLRQQKKNDIK